MGEFDKKSGYRPPLGPKNQVPPSERETEPRKNITCIGPNDPGTVVNLHGLGELDGRYRVVGRRDPGGKLELERVEDKANAVSWSLPDMEKTTADWMGLRMWVTPGVGIWLWSMARGGVVQRKGKADTKIGAQIEVERTAKKFIKEQADLVDKLAAWGAPLSEETAEKLKAFLARPPKSRMMVLTEEQRAELRESLAAVQHDIWAHFMRYLVSECHTATDDWSGNPVLLIPTDKVDRWKRQMDTAYADLTEKEKDSDREQADKVLAVLAPMDDDTDPSPE